MNSSAMSVLEVFVKISLEGAVAMFVAGDKPETHGRGQETIGTI